MVYYLSDIERKMLEKRIRPLTRTVGVSEELRGWSWDRSPLKPYHEAGLPMYSICGKYCPNSRDVYLRHVLKKPAEVTYPVSLGAVVHSTVNGAYKQVRLRNFSADFEKWYEHQGFKPPANPELVKKYSRIVWEHVLANAESRFREATSSQPYSEEEDMIMTAAPFMIEHKISGNLLGCSGILSVDCFDYLHNIIFDVKTATRKGENSFYRLYATGYALVFESVYEVPVDIGCTVYLNFKDDRLIIERDLFHINDDLRSWWVEERDRKSEIVYEEKDPGIVQCERKCMYANICKE
ncbi:type I-A CRISPR-associated protein Cas4/Csa1 [Methanocella conradii]|uniref:type I-A CRISPR-associated protein Cas4/Csa1 n=1 Tax=Methanocella conradii TaxID=1175444 RepID=UPI0024B37C4D|nr:type I-A CRISPR-associated protein Cas4/Csa1 [Methanocella conradii]MDI6897283.1 type I-A CRISPR-associated protein Cas4/Csa1 [Methanocella conradii]